MFKIASQQGNRDRKGGKKALKTFIFPNNPEIIIFFPTLFILSSIFFGMDMGGENPVPGTGKLAAMKKRTLFAYSIIEFMASGNPV